MGKYQVDVTLEGYIEIEAESETEAKNHAEDGFSLDQFQCTDSEIGEISLSKELAPKKKGGVKNENKMEPG